MRVERFFDHLHEIDSITQLLSQVKLLALSDPMLAGTGSTHLDSTQTEPVSYTHLTLPTIYSV